MTILQPDGEPMAIYDAAMAYIARGTPTVVFAGEEYGTGSSRDWAAKGTQLLGVKAVIARSFERIHRCNLVGMGVLPCQFKGSRQRRLAGHRRQRGVRHRRAGGGHSATDGCHPGDPPRRWRGPARAAAAADRHADRGRLLPARRYPALRPARVAGAAHEREAAIANAASRSIRARSHRAAAPACSCFAGLCLSSLDATAKYLVRDHALFLVVWARYAGQMAVVTPFAWRRGGPAFWRTRRLGMQLLRSAMLLCRDILLLRRDCDTCRSPKARRSPSSRRLSSSCCRVRSSASGPVARAGWRPSPVSRAS